MDTGSRKFAAIVVAILLVLGGLVGALFLTLPKDGDDGPNEGWSVEDDNWYTVDGDATWTDWDLRLDGQINVDEGGSLLLEDCRIEVPLERLVFDGQAVIDVRPGASLELRNSELFLSADPELDQAWICTDYYSGGTVPHMWRVVNLLEATSPILEFDIELWSEDCRIAVAVQVTPDAELEIVGVYGTDEVGWREWSHVEVELDGYIGTTPRVVVFVDSWGRSHIGEVLLLSGIRVYDGDEPLPGDILMTGDPVEDGWSIELFGSFRGSLRDSSRGMITSLLACDGDVTIMGSRIGSPIGFSRIAEDYKPHHSSQEYYTWSTLDFDAWIADILIFGGSLKVSDSDISFVPIHGQECTVEIDGTTFVGNNDMMTLVRSEGSLTRSSFTSDRGAEFVSLGFSDDIMWQVAIEDVDSPDEFVIEDCTFSGFGVEEGDGYGLHLNNANIRPRDCAFDDLEVAFWNHEGDPGLDWDAVARSNSFGDNCAYWYIDTRVVRLEYDGLDMPNHSSSDGNWDWVSYEEDIEVPFDVYIYRTYTFAIIFAPVLLTGPEHGIVPVFNVTVWEEPFWAKGRYVSFDPHDESTTFWFQKEAGPYNDMWALYRLDHERGYSAGRVHQNASIYMYNISFQDPQIDLYRDGAFMGRLDATVSEPVFNGYYVFINVSHDMAIPAGLHQITLSLTALSVASQSRVLVGTFNITFFRIDEARDDLDTTALAGVNQATILIDPDVEQEGVELMFASTGEAYYDFEIITWIGSRIVLETIDVPGNAAFYLFSVGPGEVVIGDVTASYMSLATANTSIVYQGTMEGMIDLWTASSDVVVNAQIRGGPLSVVLLWGSNLTMEGSAVDCTGGVQIDAVESNATISDCTFTAIEGSTPVLLIPSENSSMRIYDCTFRGTSVYASPRNVNCTLDVKDCTFEGPGSYLLLMNDRRPGYYYERYVTPIIPREGEVSGNVFQGAGTGMVFHLDSRNGFLGPNIFNDGAKSLALLAFQVSFEDRTYGCYTYVINATEAGGLETLDLFDEYYWRDWFRFLVDMTDDPLNGGLPDMIPVVIRITNRWSNWQGVVVTFDNFPLDGEPFTVDVPMWDYIHTDLLMLIPKLDDPGSWWTDP